MNRPPFRILRLPFLVLVFLLVSSACEVLSDPPAADLSIDAPAEGSTFDVNHVMVTGSTTDIGSIDSMNAVVDGVTTDCTVTSSEFVCPVFVLREGPNQVEVIARTGSGDTFSDAVVVQYSPPAGSFDIEIVYFDEGFSASQKAAFDEAAAMWERIIVADEEPVSLTRAANESCRQGEPAYNDTVDDILIFATSFSEPDSTTIGIAGPCLTRSSGPSAGINLVGYMEFNTAYLEDLENTGQLVDAITHEMGHVLGIGTNWEDTYRSLLDFVATNADAEDCVTSEGFEPEGEPVYIGPHGMTAYDRLGGRGPVPVDATGLLGTRCGHWDDDRFGYELMTGILDPDVANPLSELSAASMYDLGFTVNVARAEPYSLPVRPAARAEHALDLASREVLLRPIGGVDPSTGESVPLRTR